MMRFRDRVDAGQQLAEKLMAYRGQAAVVYALPRGGVVLGAEVARALQLPLDLIITRKIGHPLNPEYGVCAVSETGYLVCNADGEMSRQESWFTQTVQREIQEAKRRHLQYLGNRDILHPSGKTAILVDDGIATGLTMRAAVHEIKAMQPARVVVAVPIIPPETAELLHRDVDEVVAVDIPDAFLGAVGAYYHDFRPITDDEVIDLLGAMRKAA